MKSELSEFKRPKGPVHRSYLATIMSEAEQDPLEEVIITGSAGSWQSGWIGGVIRQGQTFEWVSPPLTPVTPFWRGNGATGLPYDAASGQLERASDFSPLEFDQKPGVSGHRKRLLVRLADTTAARYRYINWAGGTDSDSWDSRIGVSSAQRAQRCEPLITADGAAVAIHGHSNRDGTWVSHPSGTVSCEATQNHPVCVFYREFDTNGLPTDMVLGERLTVNMERFREFCES